MKTSKLIRASILLPKDFREQFELKLEEMRCTGISETIRVMLGFSLKDPRLKFLNFDSKKTKRTSNHLSLTPYFALFGTK